MANKPHHRDRRFIIEGAAIRLAANADPTTRCWRCGKTLAEHDPHHDGTRPTWTAGHVIDGDKRSPLKPEASTCNTSAGATAGNAARVGDSDAAAVAAAKRWRG